MTFPRCLLRVRRRVHHLTPPTPLASGMPVPAWLIQPRTAVDEHSQLRVAEAAESDIDAIAAFFWEGWRQAGPDAPGWAGASEEVIRELTEPGALRSRLGGPDRRMFLAWDGDRVVGFSATRELDDATIELAGIVVLQGRLGHGIGTELLEVAIASARQARSEWMVVRTETSNARAADFYRSHGFGEETTMTEVVDGREMDLIELSLDLTK